MNKASSFVDIQKVQCVQDVTGATCSAKWSNSCEALPSHVSVQAAQNSECIKSRVFIDEWAKEPPQLNCTVTEYHSQRNARHKNHGPPGTCCFIFPHQHLYKLQNPSLESMKRSGMHARTVCCASVHIENTDCTYICPTY